MAQILVTFATRICFAAPKDAACHPSCDSSSQQAAGYSRQIFINNIDMCYGWDAHQRIWIQENGTYELLPLNAVYIKVHSGATATAAFIASQDLSSPPSPSWSLDPGANLIGAAPAFAGGEFPPVPLVQALISIAEASGGLRGYTMVITPDSTSRPGLMPLEAGCRTCYPLKDIGW